MTVTGRRDFFKCSIDELIAAFDQSRGRQSFKLSDLPGLPQEQLGLLIPAILDASSVVADGHRFVVRGPRGKLLVLFESGSMEEDIWSRMDGQSSLREIADALAIAWNETSERAFARTREVFLRLAEQQICIPRNALEP